MRMPKKFQVLNLSTDFPHNIKTPNFLSIQDLHCNFVPRQFMFANYKKDKQILTNAHCIKSLFAELGVSE